MSVLAKVAGIARTSAGRIAAFVTVPQNVSNRGSCLRSTKIFAVTSKAIALLPNLSVPQTGSAGFACFSSLMSNCHGRIDMIA